MQTACIICSMVGGGSPNSSVCWLLSHKVLVAIPEGVWDQFGVRKYIHCGLVAYQTGFSPMLCTAVCWDHLMSSTDRPSYSSWSLRLESYPRPDGDVGPFAPAWNKLCPFSNSLHCTCAFHGSGEGGVLTKVVSSLRSFSTTELVSRVLEGC